MQWNSSICESSIAFVFPILSTPSMLHVLLLDHMLCDVVGCLLELECLLHASHQNQASVCSRAPATQPAWRWRLVARTGALEAMGHFRLWEGQKSPVCGDQLSAKAVACPVRNEHECDAGGSWSALHPLLLMQDNGLGKKKRNVYVYEMKLEGIKKNVNKASIS